MKQVKRFETDEEANEWLNTYKGLKSIEIKFNNGYWGVIYEKRI